MSIIIEVVQHDLHDQRSILAKDISNFMPPYWRMALSVTIFCHVSQFLHLHRLSEQVNLIFTKCLSGFNLFNVIPRAILQKNIFDVMSLFYVRRHSWRNFAYFTNYITSSHFWAPSLFFTNCISRSKMVKWLLEHFCRLYSWYHVLFVI